MDGIGKKNSLEGKDAEQKKRPEQKKNKATFLF
jgi:hypothetical protein